MREFFFYTMIVTSRVYSFLDTDSIPNPMLIPYEDFANHSDDPELSYTFTEQGFQLTANREIRAG